MLSRYLCHMGIRLIMLVAFLYMSGGDIHAQLSIGGPYEPDSATVVLMHFDQNFDNDQDPAYEIAQPNSFGSVSFLEMKGAGDLGHQVRFDNDSPDDKSHIQIPDTAALDLTGNWTIEYWLNTFTFGEVLSPDDWRYHQTPLIKPGDGSPSNEQGYARANYYMRTPLGNGKFIAGYHSQSPDRWIDITSPKLLHVGEWYHVTFIRDTSKQVIIQMLHQNAEDPGRLPNEQSDSLEITYFEAFKYGDGTPRTSDQPLFIGATPEGDTLYGNMDGFMDELRISNVVRSFSMPPAITNVTQYISKPSTGTYTIEADIQTLASNKLSDARLHYRSNEGPWQQVAMAEQEHHTFSATIPSQNKGDTVQYWIEAETSNGLRATSPARAPSEELYYSFSIWDAPWPTMGQNNRHTGLSPYSGTREDTLKWKVDVENIIQSQAAIGPEGDIYFTNGKYLYAVNTSDGSIKWKSEPADSGSTYFSSSPTISSNGTIYIGTAGYQTGGVQAIWASDGSHRWTYEIGEEVRTSPVVGHRGNVYVGTIVRSGDSTLYALDASDGSFQWRFNAQTPVTSSPAIGPDGTVYVGGEDLYALDPRDGSRQWTFKTEGSAHRFSPVIDSGGTLYQGSGTQMLYALSSGDGTQKWTYKNGIGAPSIGPQGDLYLSRHDGIKALDAAEGTLKWQVDTMHIMRSTGPAIGANGTLYIGTADGKIYDINADDGELQWDFNTHNEFESMPVIGPGGTIYVGSTTLFQVASRRITKEESASGNAFYAIGGTKQTDLPPSDEKPNRVELQQNYPNPFNPKTQIKFSLPQATQVELAVYNTLGQRVATLVNGKRQAGQHSVTFNASNLSSGVYVYRLKAESFSQSRKMLLLK